MGTLEKFPSQNRSVTGYSSLSSVHDPGGEFYSYAPALIQDGTTEHLFSCQNRNSGEIRDVIYYHKRENGIITESKIILEPGPAGAWDCFHVCDPCVVDGSFNLFGTSYTYALFYTGNNMDASKNNQVGVAFSNSFEGPWIRYPYPLIHTPFGPGEWGVGQPSITKVNGAGEVLVFYTQGMDSTDPDIVAGWRAHLDMSDMTDIKTFSYRELTNNGLTAADDGPDYLNNFDMIYDPSRDRFYCVREQHPYPEDFPFWIGENLQIVSIPGTDIWQGTGTWTVEGEITPARTGFDRNHNAGIKRSAAGTLLDPGRLDILFENSSSEASDPACAWPGVLWTYDIWQISAEL